MGSGMKLIQQLNDTANTMESVHITANLQNQKYCMLELKGMKDLINLVWHAVETLEMQDKVIKRYQKEYESDEDDVNNARD